MDVSTKQQKIAKIAEKYSDESIKSLNHYIDEEWLREAYRRTKKDTAAGVDNVTVDEYEKELDTNLRALLDRFKEGTYRAPPVKRVYIPKDEAGKEKRAIGIPTLEDKLLQRAVKMVLEPVLEVFFKDCSFGFRPERSIQEAEEEIWQTAMNYGGCWVLEVDIRKYFDNITHQHLRKFYRDKVCDGVIVRMLDKWLKAGILEEGKISYPKEGTPQGGVISPLLSNLNLHEVLDKWFEEEIKPRLNSRARLIRYADDFVIMFEKKKDAKRVKEVIPKRLKRYGLKVHPLKTRLVDYNKPKKSKGSESFDFLGFTHYWGKSRSGKLIPKRKTAQNRLKKAVKRTHRWCKENRHLPVEEQWNQLCKKLSGHYNFYGITFNSKSIGIYYERVKKSWQKWLNRRNRENNTEWEKFNQILRKYTLPKPRIVHSYVT